MKQIVSILGSTGSIGTSALELARKNPDKVQVAALSAGDQIDLFAKQVEEFKPRLVSTKTEEGCKNLKAKLAHLSGVEFMFGHEGAEAVASYPQTTIVLSAIVGAAGLRPTLAAARASKIIALANKESLVVAGALVKEQVAKHGATLLPVDSEHSAIHQCLPKDYKSQHVHKLILTASGGPFFQNKDIELKNVTVEEALKHPNWAMGPKITIDSATLMNKGLEMIEAHWLYDLPSSKIDVIVHPKSIVHSMVEFIDGSIVAQLGVPDMTGPIAYALFYPERVPNVMNRLDLAEIGQLHFFKPDHQRFPAINLAYKAMDEGPLHPAVLNAANEVTVAAFLNREIGFTAITEINEKVLETFTHTSRPTQLNDYLETDSWAREKANAFVTQRRR